jgi:hypothetical protein
LLNLWLDFHNVFSGIWIWFWGFVNWVMMLVYVSLLEWVLVDRVVSIGRIHRLDSLLLEIVIAKSEWWLMVGFLVMFAWICWFWIGVGLWCLIRRESGMKSWVFIWWNMGRFGWVFLVEPKSGFWLVIWWCGY